MQQLRNALRGLPQDRAHYPFRHCALRKLLTAMRPSRQDTLLGIHLIGVI